MNDLWDLIVIGGGASGMMAAITAAKKPGRRILILERNDKLGKKLLQTGNGRCNLTNLKMDSDCYCRENAEFAMEVIRDFDEKAVTDFFFEAGLLLHNRQGYVYPYSDQAVSVNDVLNLLIRKRNISVSYETVVERISKTDCFHVITNNKEFCCNKLILAAGGKAYPKTGSDGSGYRLAKSLGHHIVTPLPALTALSGDLKEQKKISGVRCDGIVTLMADGELLGRQRGEIQMTDYGISGIPVFQISRYAVQMLAEGKTVFCEIDLLPDYDEKMVEDMIFHRFQTADFTAGECLSGLLHKKLTALLLLKAGIVAEKKAAKIDHAARMRLVKSIKHFSFTVTGYKDFHFGQVCQGGVPVCELSSTTMESKLVKDLYICGELADIDGICGGYNLQWAWSSGHQAGRAVWND